MPLDVFINGSGFGETIILRWKEGRTICGGIVDCYSAEDRLGGTFDICEWMDELKIGKLRFALATHPHLDHLQNFDKVLAKFEGRLEGFYYWGILEWEMWVDYYDALRRNRSADGKDRKLVEKAYHARRMLGEAGRQALGDLRIYFPRKHSLCFPRAPQRSIVRLYSLGPWPKPCLGFLRHVSNSIDRVGRVSEEPRAANAVSSAVLLKYGRAQVVLGGDMEAPNWRAFRKNAGCPELNPCLVKVGHHGSKTGKIPGMWKHGFFGSKNRPLVAVVTPWNGRLPEKTALREISRAVSQLHVTGQRAGGRGRPLRSFVHVRVNTNGRATVVENSPNAGRLSF